MPGRKFNTPTYRYGFNGKEKEDEIANAESAYDDFGARLYDARLGRFMKMDPLFEKYSGFSPYHYSYNSPIVFIDNNGRDIFMYDKLGTLVAQIKIDNHEHVYFQMKNYAVPDNWEGATITDLNPYIEAMKSQNPFIAQLLEKMPDAIGVGFNIGAETPFVSAQGGFEAVLFLTGPNQLETHYYYSLSTSGGIIRGGGEVGAQAYITLGYAYKTDRADFTDEFWAGPEESYSASFPEIGGISLEWSNKSGDATGVPDFRTTVNGVPNENCVNQFEVVISPSAANQKVGASYTAGIVVQATSLEKIVPPADKLVNSMFEIERLTKKEHDKLLKNNRNRKTEVSVPKKTGHMNVRHL